MLNRIPRLLATLTEAQSRSMSTETRLSSTLGKKGQLNTPGITFASKKAIEELLHKDAEAHHCFFNKIGFHNHLTHHILAAYDLGTPAAHLKKMYEEEDKEQRPKYLQDGDKSITVTKDNWIQYLSNESAYGAYLIFFTKEIKELGVVGSLEKYVFSPEANAEGVWMLTRVMAGAVHPFIQIGYGAEFGVDSMIATGLAMAALHRATTDFVAGTPKTSPGINIFEVLTQVNESDVLKPGPYNGDLLLSARLKAALMDGGAEEIMRICSQYDLTDNISEAEVAKKTEEIIWAAVLLTFGSGKKGRKPRLDFFLMHLLTSSLFLRPFCGILKNPAHKSALLRAYVPILVLTVLTRGRPRFDSELLMSYTAVPRPPSAAANTSKPVPEAIGDPSADEDYNPWPAIIDGARYHSDAHTLKSLRTLIYAAQHFGDTPPGGVPGASLDGGKGGETYQGISKVDGTVFIRAAGLLLDTLGWSGHGQKEGVWDRSALGWDAAWDNKD